MSESIIECFSNIKDPRIDRKKLHSLSDILVLTVCAMLSGANGYEAIEEFGHNKESWLRTFLPLKNGIPSEPAAIPLSETVAPGTPKKRPVGSP